MPAAFPMSLQEYKTVLRRVTRWTVPVMIVLMFGGEAGALYLTSRLVASSSWESWQVCWAMFPTLIAPFLIAAMIAEQLDKRIGLKCQCGQSLTIGPHTARLMREGGKCPRCERVVVESENR
jgi:hypothetical protein